jgi:hypothetical protein
LRQEKLAVDTSEEREGADRFREPVLETGAWFPVCFECSVRVKLFGVFLGLSG